MKVGGFIFRLALCFAVSLSSLYSEPQKRSSLLSFGP